MIAVKNITKKYGNKRAVNNINISFGRGITGLLGPNGAGKSTLMKMIATTDQPTTGRVIYKEKDITKRPSELRMELGYLPQEFGMYPNMSAFEFLEYMAAMKSLDIRSARKRIQNLLEILGLSDAGKKQLGGFSGGMKQRVGIAQALLNDPAVLIVDEPTVGLDPVERIQFRNLLVSIATERVIILSTHIVSDIEAIAPQIVILEEGNVVAHSAPEQIINECKGKVWATVVDPNWAEEYQRRFVISNAMQRADGLHLRIISDTKPQLNAQMVDPTLEDGYLYVTNRAEVVI